MTFPLVTMLRALHPELRGKTHTLPLVIILRLLHPGLRGKTHKLPLVIILRVLHPGLRAGGLWTTTNLWQLFKPGPHLQKNDQHQQGRNQSRHLGTDRCRLKHPGMRHTEVDMRNNRSWESVFDC